MLPVLPDVRGILNRIKSKDVARLLSFDINEFNNSLSKEDVLVILRVCVKPVTLVQPVEITPEAIS
jgi:hypothetical protein